MTGSGINRSESRGIWNGPLSRYPSPPLTPRSISFGSKSWQWRKRGDKGRIWQAKLFVCKGSAHVKERSVTQHSHEPPNSLFVDMSWQRPSVSLPVNYHRSSLKSNKLSTVMPDFSAVPLTMHHLTAPCYWKKMLNGWRFWCSSKTKLFFCFGLQKIEQKCNFMLVKKRGLEICLTDFQPAKCLRWQGNQAESPKQAGPVWKVFLFF